RALPEDLLARLRRVSGDGRLPRARVLRTIAARRDPRGSANAEPRALPHLAPAAAAPLLLRLRRERLARDVPDDLPHDGGVEAPLAGRRRAAPGRRRGERRSHPLARAALLARGLHRDLQGRGPPARARELRDAPRRSRRARGAAR